MGTAASLRTAAAAAVNTDSPLPGSRILVPQCCISFPKDLMRTHAPYGSKAACSRERNGKTRSLRYTNQRGVSGRPVRRIVVVAKSTGVSFAHPTGPNATGHAET